MQELRIERARTGSSGTFDPARWRGESQARIEAASALVNDPRAWHGHRRLLEELLGPFDGVTRRGASAWELRVRRPDGYRELFVRRPQCDYDEVPELGSFRRIGAWVYGIDSES